MKATIIFYQVADNKRKLAIIKEKAEEAYKLEKRLLITVPSLQAAQYVDELLWSYQDTSFCPHVISDFPTSSWIAITLQDKANLNQASSQLNLNPSPSELTSSILEIFELFDLTTSEKKEQSKKRLSFYQTKEFNVKPI